MAEEKKEKKENPVKKFFGEFKKFITRGNVLDMAVGVIVGGAFTGIVNGLSNYILKPIINWLLALVLGKDGLAGAITPLSPVYTETVDAVTGETVQVLDLANSIYIDWGAFISTIINFLLIAFVLFMIVRAINKVAEAQQKAIAGMNSDEKKAVREIRKERKVSKAEAKAIYEKQVEEAKAKAEAEAKAEEAKAEEEARLAEEKAMANTRLLEEIRDLLKQK